MPNIVACEDCGMPYPFPKDTVLPNDQWELISGHSDGGGLLCAGCIVERAAKIPGVIVVKARLMFAEDYPA